MDVFVKKMIEVKNKIMDKMKENKNIIMRADDWRDFKTATIFFFYVGRTSKKGTKRLETTATLQESIGVVPMMIIIYNFQ